jgi:hypothetical protein
MNRQIEFPHWPTKSLHASMLYDRHLHQCQYLRGPYLENMVGRSMGARTGGPMGRVFAVPSRFSIGYCVSPLVRNTWYFPPLMALSGHFQ